MNMGDWEGKTLEHTKKTAGVDELAKVLGPTGALVVAIIVSLMLVCLKQHRTQEEEEPTRQV